MEFPTKRFQPKKDSLRAVRGGRSAFLYIACAGCTEPAMVYQKDGPGPLKRCYADRIAWPHLVQAKVAADSTKQTEDISPLTCNTCKQPLASFTIYKKENRPAYEIIPERITIYHGLKNALAHRPTHKLDYHPE